MDFLKSKECKLIEKSLKYQEKAYINESDSDGNDIDDDDIVNNVQYTVSQMDLDDVLNKIMEILKMKHYFGTQDFKNALRYLNFIIGESSYCGT